MKTTDSDISVLLIGSPFPHYSRKRFLQKLSSVLSEVCDEVYVMGANKPVERPNIEWDEFVIEDEIPWISRQMLFFRYQLSSVLRSKPFNHIIIRDPTSILSIPLFRFTNTSHSMFLAQQNERRLINFVSYINALISDEIIVESPSVLSQWSISDTSKSRIGATYVDTQKYSPELDFSDRTNILGYIGILEERKGISPLMESVPTIIEQHPGISVQVAGDGSMRNKVERSQDKLENLEYLGYISDSKVVDFYNRLTLLILPTKSEGIPNVALEAMSCGTPVLATSVGGIPDLIEDGENGFLMEKASPDAIEQNVDRVMNHDLSSVSSNARSTIVSQYTFADAVERYKKIILS